MNQSKIELRVMGTTHPHREDYVWSLTSLGPEKKHWEGQGVRPRKCRHVEMNPWKDQTLQRKTGFKRNLPDFISNYRTIRIQDISGGMELPN